MADHNYNVTSSGVSSAPVVSIPALLSQDLMTSSQSQGNILATATDSAMDSQSQSLLGNISASAFHLVTPPMSSSSYLNAAQVVPRASPFMQPQPQPQPQMIVGGIGVGGGGPGGDSLGLGLQQQQQQQQHPFSNSRPTLSGRRGAPAPGASPGSYRGPASQTGQPRQGSNPSLRRRGSENNNLQNEIKNLVAEICDLRKQFSEFSRKQDAHGSRLVELSDKQVEVKSVVEYKFSELVKKMGELQDRLHSVCLHLDENAKQLKGLATKVSKAANHDKSLLNESKQIQDTLGTQLLTSEKTLLSAVYTLGAAITTLDAKLSALPDELASMQAYSSDDNASKLARLTDKISPVIEQLTEVLQQHTQKNSANVETQTAANIAEAQTEPEQLHEITGNNNNTANSFFSGHFLTSTPSNHNHQQPKQEQQHKEKEDNSFMDHQSSLISTTSTMSTRRKRGFFDSAIKRKLFKQPRPAEGDGDAKISSIAIVTGTEEDLEVTRLPGDDPTVNVHTVSRRATIRRRRRNLKDILEEDEEEVESVEF